MTAADFLPRLFILEEEYRVAVLRAELSWVRAVTDDLHSGRITWTEEWMRGIAARFDPGTPAATLDEP